jgi:hypothetical protein
MGDENEKKKVANKKEITQKSSQEATSAAFPDVCETPSPGGPIPIPYPNIAKSSDTSSGSKKVKADGKEVSLKSSSYPKSTGDEPSTTESSEWKKVEPQTQTIIGFVKKHPVLMGVVILTVIVIAWILVSNLPHAPRPFEPEEPIFSLNFCALARDLFP